MHIQDVGTLLLTDDILFMHVHRSVSQMKWQTLLNTLKNYTITLLQSYLITIWTYVGHKLKQKVSLIYAIHEKKRNADLKMKFHLCCKILCVTDTRHETDDHDNSQEWVCNNLEVIYSIFDHDHLALSNPLMNKWKLTIKTSLRVWLIGGEKASNHCSMNPHKPLHEASQSVLNLSGCEICFWQKRVLMNLSKKCLFYWIPVVDNFRMPLPPRHNCNLNTHTGWKQS